MEHPPSRKRSTKRLVLAAAVVAVITAIALLVFRPGSQESEEVVNIGYLPIYVDLPLFVALDNGYFEERGINVTPVRFESSPNMGTSFVNGDVDFVASIATSVALSTESRDPGRFKVFIVDAESKEEYLSALVSMPSSGIDNVEDLRGKTVGIFPGPTAVTFFRLLFAKYGLDPDVDLSLVELPPGQHVQALVSGSVDALATYEPMATEAVVVHGAVKFLPAAIETEIIDPWQAGVWLVSSDFLRRDPETAHSVIEALYEAVDFIRRNPTEAKQSLRNHTGIDINVALRTPNIPFTMVDEIDTTAFQRHADILRDAGVISRRFNVNSLIIDLR
jgi:NitT/TauT family transport system substrate-binding protein